jgi:hypothetical protein
MNNSGRCILQHYQISKIQKKTNLVDNANKHQHRQIKLEAQPTEPVSLT